MSNSGWPELAGIQFSCSVFFLSSASPKFLMLTCWKKKPSKIEGRFQSIASHLPFSFILSLSFYYYYYYFTTSLKFYWCSFSGILCLVGLNRVDSIWTETLRIITDEVIKHCFGVTRIEYLKWQAIRNKLNILFQIQTNWNHQPKIWNDLLRFCNSAMWLAIIQ